MVVLNGSELCALEAKLDAAGVELPKHMGIYEAAECVVASMARSAVHCGGMNDAPCGGANATLPNLIARAVNVMAGEIKKAKHVSWEAAKEEAKAAVNATRVADLHAGARGCVWVGRVLQGAWCSSGVPSGIAAFNL